MKHLGLFYKVGPIKQSQARVIQCIYRCCNFSYSFIRRHVSGAPCPSNYNDRRFIGAHLVGCHCGCLPSCLPKSLQVLDRWDGKSSETATLWVRNASVLTFRSTRHKVQKSLRPWLISWIYDICKRKNWDIIRGCIATDKMIESPMDRVIIKITPCFFLTPRFREYSTSIPERDLGFWVFKHLDWVFCFSMKKSPVV